MNLTQLNARLSALIEFGDKAIIGHGRVHNPLYDPKAAAKKGTHKMGEGKEMSVKLKDIISPQATINHNKARRVFDDEGALPTLQRSGRKFIVHDGNHRIVSRLRAGKRVVRALVQ